MRPSRCRRRLLILYPYELDGSNEVADLELELMMRYGVPCVDSRPWGRRYLAIMVNGSVFAVGRSVRELRRRFMENLRLLRRAGYSVSRPHNFE